MDTPTSTTTPSTTPVTTATPPTWPYPDIVAMTAHTGSGQWRKRYRGRDYYFGELARPDLALARWRLDWPRITAGKDRATTPTHPKAPAPTTGSADRITIAELLEASIAELAERRLSPRTRRDYAEVAEKLLAHLPRRFRDLDARALSRVREIAWAHLSPLKQGHRLSHARTVLRAGCTRLAITMPDLTAAKAPTHRHDAALAADTRAKKILTVSDFRRLLTEAIGRARSDPDYATMPAEILLALNGALGPNETATLTASAVRPPPPNAPKRKGKAATRTPATGDGWILQPRTKTAQRRAIPLWPETLAAINAARAARAGLHPPADYLLTTLKGDPINADTSSAMQQRMQTLRDAVGLGSDENDPTRLAVTWYWFRYTFRFISHGAKVADQGVARRLIMGHKPADVHDDYLGPLPVADLVAIAEHVRRWALPPRERAKLFGDADRPTVAAKRPREPEPVTGAATMRV